MARKDIYYGTVKKTLDKDDWKITYGPFRLRIGKKRGWRCTKVPNVWTTDIRTCLIRAWNPRERMVAHAR